jgi:hypothetical protein
MTDTQKHLLLLFLLFVCPVQGFSQDSTNSTAEPSLSNFFSDLFSSKSDELTKLVEEKKYKEADKFYSKEKDYFRENAESTMPALRKLALALNSTFEPKLEAELNSISKFAQSNPANWASQKTAISTAANLIQEYYGVEVLKLPALKSQKISALEAALGKMQSDLQSGAIRAFRGFDHASQGSFFDSYPIDLGGKTFFDGKDSIEMLRDLVGAFTGDQLAAFQKKYSAQLEGNAEAKEVFATRYFAALLVSEGTKIPLKRLLSILTTAKEKGLEPKSLPGIKIAFAETTSKTLLKEGQIEFPAKIDLDLPFDPIKAEIDDALDVAAKSGADYLIVFDVARATASRRIISKTSTESKHLSGVRSEANPNYDLARGKLMEAQSGLSNAQGQYAQGIAGAIIKGIAVGAWQDNVTKANQLIASTPPSRDIPLFTPYRYSMSDVKTTRAMTTNYYVIDKVAKTYYKGVFDTTETKSYKISYDLHDKDPEKNKILSRYDKEEDVTAFETSPMKVAASALINDYLANEKQSKPLPPIEKLRDEMVKDKNKALAEYKSRQFNTTPSNDPRFGSVVVVLNPKGSMGTGFYVAPELVMTNYHVVEGVKFVEMKMYNGMETFGKVVKSDVRLDLALIKVQDRGVPVEFHDKNTVDLGSTVEAIGHPKGLLFTITRGVVSAVRKKKSVYAVGGKDVLFVQTDAAINPGNSGGPLFLGQKVVGVNNNKLAGGSEGLGFAVHYSEIAQFMKESF